MTEEQQTENYADENIWGVIGDIFEEAMYYDVPMPVIVATALIGLAFYFVKRRFGK